MKNDVPDREPSIFSPLAVLNAHSDSFLFRNTFSIKSFERTMSSVERDSWGDLAPIYELVERLTIPPFTLSPHLTVRRLTMVVAPAS